MGFEVRWFSQPHDHFHFGRAASAPWQQRYLLNDTFWGTRPPLANGCKGPLLFYTGNEGPVDAFWHSTGFLTDVLAPRLGALLVFGEERYYGASLPSGDPFLYLSTEQVLADYAALLTSLRANLSAAACPVVAFGGSYGGTLTTLLRLKYPHVVAGGLAASAPLGYYAPRGGRARGVTPTTWFETVARVYEEAGCYGRLVAAVRRLNATVRTGNASAVAEAFGLCSAPPDADAFVYWVTEALESIPQVDYPEPSGTLPGSPVNATCALFAAPHADPIGALSRVATWYYGPPRAPAGCTPAAEAQNPQAGGGVPGDGPSAGSAWGYQSCTETLHAFSTLPGAWRSFTFDAAAQAALCEQYFGVTPRIGWLELWSGGYDIPRSGVTNIIWSNGRRDPWHGGGFLEPTDAVPGGAVFVMQQTAHHQDLRLPTPLDPPELTAVRKQEEAIIRSWVEAASA
ncbi:hypothetical protein AB1Y20_022092 [Prymnesium parvum]|uniref:Prolylcarboxypeptidase n=1 Tax=Prymnesium parvum TaxID=97485 RepID=A0AB34JF54_PRYPA